MTLGRHIRPLEGTDGRFRLSAVATLSCLVDEWQLDIRA